MSDKIRYDSIVLGFLKPNYEDMERPYKASVSYPKIVNNGSKGSSDPPPDRPNKYGMIIIVTMYVCACISYRPPTIRSSTSSSSFFSSSYSSGEKPPPTIKVLYSASQKPTKPPPPRPNPPRLSPTPSKPPVPSKGPRAKVYRERERDTLYLISSLSPPPSLSLRLFTIILLNMMMRYHLLPDHLSF